MSIVEGPVLGLQRRRMSWEEYLELPAKPTAEWVDGEVVVSPPNAAFHGVSTVELAVALRTTLPELVVMTEVGLLLPRNRLRAPDLMVVASRPQTTFVEEPPILVVEVLSPSTRSEDLLRKGPEYAEGGVGQYWVVDPEARSLEVFANVDGTWEPLLRLDDAHAVGEVAVGDHGVVRLDLTTILGGPTSQG